MMKTLLIEDDIDFADVISSMLTKENCDIEVAYSMLSAKDRIGHFDHFDLVLLDIWLDGESSLSLIDRIRLEDPSLPIVLMSGGGGPLSLDVATSIGSMKGVNHLLQKPIRRARLQQLLSQIRSK